MNDLVIRTAKEEDLELLEQDLPSGGLSRHHETRFKDQQEGISTFLIAFIENRPVGFICIKWKQPCEPEVRAKYPNIPTLYAAGVKPELQSQGSGTKLILYAENIIRKKGHKQVGLAVALTNHKARKLYKRLGYRESEIDNFTVSWPIVTKLGEHKREYETCSFFIKSLN